MKIHFIGIGGIGMSALAGISKKMGHEVSGSDKEKSQITDSLRKIGIKVYIGHKKENLPKKPDIIVYTSAIEKTNPEYQAAIKLKAKILERADYLGILMKDKKAIAVSGTHGKTTISSMIAVILKKAGLKPTVAVGGLIPEFDNSNWSYEEGEYMVVEACEYKDAFLKLKPFITIISNIEAEHLDYFKNLEEIKKSFNKFLKLTSKNGYSIINSDNINTQKLIEESRENLKIFTYGGEGGQAEWQALNIKEESGKTYFDVYKNGQKIDEFELSIPGRHSVFNALAAILTCAELEIGLGTIKEALLDFKGASRRMETKGEIDGILLIDDYAHHPTEIKTTLEALKKFHSDRNKIWCVFQPHQHSRTKMFFNEFLESFDSPDTVIIPDIYKVRDTEDDIKSISSAYLAEELKKKGVEAIYIPTFEEVESYLKNNAKLGDLIITMGAGPVNKITDGLLKNENRKK